MGQKVKLIIFVEDDEQKKLAEYWNLAYPMSYYDLRSRLEKEIHDLLKNISRE